jgi:hypothetical protein
MTEQGTSYAFRGVVAQITATLRLPSTPLRAGHSGWSGQHGLLDYSCKPSPFRAGLLTVDAENLLAQIIVIPSDHNVMWGIGSDRFRFIYFY